MSDSDDSQLSTACQVSDVSSAPDSDIIVRFINPLTNGTYFNKPMNFDQRTSIGFLVHMVKSELGDIVFQLKVGKKVWQMDDIYGKFWLFKAVQDALTRTEEHELIVEVIKVNQSMDSDEEAAKRVRMQPEDEE